MNDKEKSLQLRQLGYSIQDISNIVNRSTGSVHNWVSSIRLTPQQRNIVLKNISIKKESYYKSMREQMFVQIKNLAAINGGTCLSSVFINGRSKIEWECSNGHTWKASWDNTKKGSGCPECLK